MVIAMDDREVRNDINGFIDMVFLDLERSYGIRFKDFLIDDLWDFE